MRLLGKASAFCADADFLCITSQLSATGSRSQSCAHTLAYTRIYSHPYSRAHVLIIVLIFVLILILNSRAHDPAYLPGYRPNDFVTRLFLGKSAYLVLLFHFPRPDFDFEPALHIICCSPSISHHLLTDLA